MILSIIPKSIVSQSLIQKNTKHNKKVEFWYWKIDHIKHESLTELLEECIQQSL